MLSFVFSNLHFYYAKDGLGLAGRLDWIPKILGLYRDQETASGEALACVFAFGYLGKSQPQILNVLEEQLDVAEHQHAAEKALFRIGAKAALDILERRAVTTGNAEMALCLLEIDGSRQQAESVLKAELSRMEERGSRQLLLDAISQLNTRQIKSLIASNDASRRILREASLEQEGSFWIGGTKVLACRGLAVFDPDTAFLAAQKALQQEEAHDRELYPYLLVQLDPPRAISTFLELIKNECSTPVLWAIGRAIAGLTTAEQVLLKALSNEQSVVRRAACFLAAKGQATNEIIGALKVLIHDPFQDVADAALDSLRDLRNSKRVKELGDELAAEPNRERQWVLLEAIATLGDPGDNGAPKPEWQNRALQAVPYGMRIYLQDRIQKRREEITKEVRRDDSTRS